VASEVSFQPANLKMAIVGCGAVGSYYGAKLARAGLPVHFLLRSDYDAVRRDGVQILSRRGDFLVRPGCATKPEEIGTADLVMIGLKTTANREFSRLLPPLVGPGTSILTLQNGLGNEEQLERLFPRDQILGGLCFVCLNRIKPGVIHHLDHGLVMLGQYGGPPGTRVRQVADWFSQADIPFQISPDLARAHWEKLAWNIPFNGLGVAAVAGYEAVISGQLQPEARRGPCLTTDRLLADERWLELIRGLIREVLAAARALGHSLDEAIVERQIERTRSMGAYTASTLLDFEQGRPLELDSLFNEPLRQAQAAGANLPLLQNLCRVLNRLDCRA
jgi:2-dehydropantoate 2-reductase